MRYTILIERDDVEGLFGVTVPALPGCVTQGETVDEAMANAREAITGRLAALHDLGEPVPIEATPPIVAGVVVEPAA